MSNESLIETVKSKATLVSAHAPDVIKTGVETLRAARDVVTGARDELKRTLKEGADKIGQKLANIATPTRKEAAAMHKAEIKAKKRAKREAEQDTATAESAAAPVADGSADGLDTAATPPARKRKPKAQSPSGSNTIQ